MPNLPIRHPLVAIAPAIIILTGAAVAPPGGLTIFDKATLVLLMILQLLIFVYFHMSWTNKKV